MRFDLKVIVGYFATSKKCEPRRSLSRISTRVSTELGSIVTSIEELVGSEGEYFTSPLTLVNVPRTVEIPRCRTENCAAECAGSRCQTSFWVCAAALTMQIRPTKTQSANISSDNFFRMKQRSISSVTAIFS